MKELPIPPDASCEQSQSIEIARGWIIDNKLQCSLLPSIWSDAPETWGVLIADFASHVADALAAESGRSRDQIHRMIAEKLCDELNVSTGEQYGNFVDYDSKGQS